MLIDDIRSYVDDVFLVTAARVARVHGTYPLSIMKVYKDNSKPNGWRVTSLSSSKDGEGCYSKESYPTMCKDFQESGYEEDLIGSIYTIPYDGILDQAGDDQGQVLLVGVHVREGGINYSDKKILFYRMEELTGESGERFRDAIKEEYRSDYLAGCGLKQGDVLGKLLALQKFEGDIWGKLCPVYLDANVGGAWGDAFLKEHILPSPFV